MKSRYLSLFALALLACGGEENRPPPKAARVTPQEELAQLGKHWVSRWDERHIYESPHPLTVATLTASTQLDFAQQGQVFEELTIEERFELRRGPPVLCRSELRVPVRVRFGQRNGETAVELSRDTIVLARKCNSLEPAGVPRDLPASVAMFVLRGEQLVAVEPAGDRRRYLPTE